MASNDEILKQVLEGRQTLLFDGGFGTMLQARKLSIPGKPADELCITNSQDITAIHKAYVDAGAQVATTNTFNTNNRALREAGSPYLVEQIYAAAAQCARNSGALFVAGDMGPLGVFLEPYGELEEDEAYELFAQNARAVEAAGCDFALIETMMDVNEALLAVRAVRENTVLPAFVTMSFNETGRTLFGVSPEQAVEELLSAGANAIGMNCSVGPTEALPVVQAYAAALRATACARKGFGVCDERVGNIGALGEEDATGELDTLDVRVAAGSFEGAASTLACDFAVPLIVQPNAGLPDMSSGEAVYHCSPEDFSQAVMALVNAGATIVGGCCGTTPAHIAAVRDALQSA